MPVEVHQDPQTVLTEVQAGMFTITITILGSLAA